MGLGGVGVLKTFSSFSLAEERMAEEKGDEKGEGLALDVELFLEDCVEEEEGEGEEEEEDEEEERIWRSCAIWWERERPSSNKEGVATPEESLLCSPSFTASTLFTPSFLANPSFFWPSDSSSEVPVFLVS